MHIIEGIHPLGDRAGQLQSPPVILLVRHKLRLSLTAIAITRLLTYIRNPRLKNSNYCPVLLL